MLYCKIHNVHVSFAEAFKMPITLASYTGLNQKKIILVIDDHCYDRNKYHKLPTI